MTTVTPKEDSVSLRAWLICGLGALFYLYEYILQVSPGVMTNPMMRDLGIDARGIGLISAFYFFAYAPMQVPAGLLYDRYGPRALLTFAVLVCSFGAIFFGVAHSVALASLGRFLMGIGSAFAFIGSLLLIAHWFPPKYFALLTGVAQLMSSVGAMVGERPFALMVDAFDWRPSILAIGVVGLMLALLIARKVQDTPEGNRTPSKEKIGVGEWRKLKSIWARPQTWWIALYSFCIWAPIATFAALWGVPYLMTLYQVNDPSEVAGACSMIWLGIAVSSPLIGWWSDRILRRCLPLTLVAFMGIVATLVILFAPKVSLTSMYFWMFVLGFAAGGQALSFGVVKDIHPHEVAGTAIGFNNMAVVAGGAVFQPLVGVLLKMNWEGVTQNGVPVYSLHDYRWALVLMPLCFLVSFLVSAGPLKETRCLATFGH